MGNRYYGDDERRMVARLEEYRDNYTAWMRDFSTPCTNNVAERALRGCKTRQKVSGQFMSVETASCFADIRTYVETCARNGVNTFEALRRLAAGDPLTLAEALASPGEESA